MIMMIYIDCKIRNVRSKYFTLDVYDCIKIIEQPRTQALIIIVIPDVSEKSTGVRFNTMPKLYQLCMAFELVHSIKKMLT